MDLVEEAVERILFRQIFISVNTEGRKEV